MLLRLIIMKGKCDIRFPRQLCAVRGIELG